MPPLEGVQNELAERRHEEENVLNITRVFLLVDELYNLDNEMESSSDKLFQMYTHIFSNDLNKVYRKLRRSVGCIFLFYVSLVRFVVLV